MMMTIWKCGLHIVEGGHCPLFGRVVEEEPAFETGFWILENISKQKKKTMLKHTITKAEELIQGDIEEVGNLTLKRPHSP